MSETAEYWKQRHEDLGEMARQDREELRATIEQLQREKAGLQTDLNKARYHLKKARGQLHE